MKKYNKIAGTLICSALLISNAAAQENSNPIDPYEGFNRRMYSFNDAIDDYVASPLATAYKTIAPQFVQTGTLNFFSNLKNINVVVNDLLQAKFSQGFADFGRLTLNTTAGLAGFVDVAKHVGLNQNDEDFDQTLATWGVPQGAYLVLPFVGPSTMRSAPASAFDTATNPASYASMIAGYVSIPVQLTSFINTRANAEGALQFINEAAVDKYIFTRESFLQWRKNLENDGKVSLDDDLLTNEKSTNTSQWREYSKDFGDVSKSFGSATQKFDDAVQHFQDAGHKIEQLKHH
jgi:phospholipid-binding lipoprotein MlaA